MNCWVAIWKSSIQFTWQMKIHLPSPIEYTEQPCPTIAGVLGWTLMILGDSTIVRRLPANVSILVPAIIEMKSLDSVVINLNQKEDYRSRVTNEVKYLNAHTLRLQDFHEGFSEQLEKYEAWLPKRWNHIFARFLYCHVWYWLWILSTFSEKINQEQKFTLFWLKPFTISYQVVVGRGRCQYLTWRNQSRRYESVG